MNNILSRIEAFGLEVAQQAYFLGLDDSLLIAKGKAPTGFEVRKQFAKIVKEKMEEDIV